VTAAAGAFPPTGSLAAFSLPVLGPTEADDIRAELLRNQAHWLRYPAHDNGAVLGLPSYQVDREDLGYPERARAINAVLRGSFGWLYDRLLEVLAPPLAERYPGPLVTADTRALPGFHLLWGDAAGERDPRAWLAHPHWDGGFLNLRWSPGLPSEIVIDRLISFTLPISLPAAGSGLTVWPVTSAMIVQLAEERDIDTEQAMGELLALYPPESHPYEVGRVFVHTGHHVHAVSPWRPRLRGDERITLQGHALHHDGAWQIHW